ncbi:MAG: substrate-binding domain-containing protein [Atribacterota bacterium]
MKYGIVMMILVLLVLGSVVFAQGKTYHIGVAVPAADHGWTGGVIWWAQKAIKEWQERDPNLTFTLVTAHNPNEQVAQVKTLMAKDINALVLLPHESGPLTPVAEEARKKGIFVVCVDRGLSRETAYDVYLAGDNPGLGRMAGEQTAKLLGGKGKVVVIEGLATQINTERVEGFKEIIGQYPDIEILAIQTGYWQRDKSFATMQTLLQKFDRIDAVWAGDDDALLGALQAIKLAKRQDIKFIFGAGGMKEVVKMIMDKDPMVPITITYPPSMIASSISIAVKAIKGEPLFPEFYQNSIPSTIILACEVVNAENAARYYFPDSVY